MLFVCLDRRTQISVRRSKANTEGDERGSRESVSTAAADRVKCGRIIRCLLDALWEGSRESIERSRLALRHPDDSEGASIIPSQEYTCMRGLCMRIAGYSSGFHQLTSSQNG